MAAIQTNVLRDGVWVTESVDLQTLLNASSNPPQPPPQQQLPSGPRYGLLTRTLMESPIAHTIIPVRLRAAKFDDVAFVGDRFVQICEFKEDGQMHQVIRKDDFGCRIRHAFALGSLPDPKQKEKKNRSRDYYDPINDTFVAGSTPSGEASSSSSPSSFSSSLTTVTSSHLPPQLLLLILEFGDCIALFIRSHPDDRQEFISSQPISQRDQPLTATFRAALDLTSRYLVLGCPQSYVVVYELESMDRLHAQLCNNEPLQLVRSLRPRIFYGAIQHLAFLHPPPHDPTLVALALLLTYQGSSLILSYQWHVGDQVHDVFATECHGYPLPYDHQVPSLVIPLTVGSALLCISHNSFSLCTGLIEARPQFDSFQVSVPPPTRSHHGTDPPLWVAWTRPFRLSPYLKTHDCLYLAREDGIVLYLEADADNTITGTTLMNKFACNISTAFCSLHDQYADILVIGGDCGPSTIWKVMARQSQVKITALPNWSPTLDMVTTRTPDPLATARSGRSGVHEPDRVFATSGRGSGGAIVEYRFGVQASIGLDLDAGLDVKKAWAFSVDPADLSQGWHILLSMPYRSVLLHVSGDFSAAQDLAQDAAPFDLTCSTLAAGRVADEWVAQVTENCVCLVSLSQSRQFPLVDLFEHTSLSTSDAAITRNVVVVACHTQTNPQFSLYIFGVDEHDGRVYPLKLIPIEPGIEVTCLFASRMHSGLPVILAGLWRANSSSLLILPGNLDGPGDFLTHEVTLVTNPDVVDHPREVLAEAISSAVYFKHSRNDIFVVGSQAGDVIILSRDGQAVTCNHALKCGSVRTDVCLLQDSTVIVTSGQVSVMLHNYDAERRKFGQLSRIWPIDASDLRAAHAVVGYVSVLDERLMANNRSVLMLSGTRVLLAEVHMRPGSLHRYIPVDGTPSRLLYSSSLRCLVAGVTRSDYPTIVFLDPDTGQDLSLPISPQRKTSFIPGLGKVGDRIYTLIEWPQVRLLGSHEPLLVVGTKHGRLILVGTQRHDGPDGPKIKYRTVFRQPSCRAPIFSAIGIPEGGGRLAFSAGTTIHLAVVKENHENGVTLVIMGKFCLSSAVMSIVVAQGKLVAMTHRDSIGVVQYSREDLTQPMHLQHVDAQRRSAVDMIFMGGADDASSTITLVGDRYAVVAGMWIPWRAPTWSPAMVFQAQLPTSIRRFCAARTQPPWARPQGGCSPKFGRMASTADDAEILGVSLDGSLHHFTLIDLAVWRLLRYIQNVALASSEVSPFAAPESRPALYELDPHPSAHFDMHVDGDVLRRCFEQRALEALFQRPGDRASLHKFLDEVDDGRHTKAFDRASEDRLALQYLRLAYDIIEYYLTPIM